MEQSTRISNYTINEDGEIILILVTEVTCDEEELAGFTYRLRRAGETKLAGEIDSIAYNLYRKENHE